LLKNTLADSQLCEPLLRPTLRIQFHFVLLIQSRHGPVIVACIFWYHSNFFGEDKMGLKKQYLKKTKLCKVTFSLDKEAVGDASDVSVVGDFNEWNKGNLPMKRLKNGSFTATITLEPNHEYHFRYFVDGARWENDWKADKYVPNEHGSEDSVVVV
jgi:Glycogen recognition site of AMP-activated protein kinase